jgi:C4-dicarboxylate-specific signal transduction histidine kinase
VNRGVELTTRLNRFTHSSDQSLAELDLNDLVAQLTLLMECFARLRKVQLYALRADQALCLATDPFRLQMVLAAGMDCLLQTAEAGAVIELQPEADRRLRRLRLQPGAGSATEPLGSNTLEAVFEPLQGILQKLRVTPALANTPATPGLSLTFAP